MGYSRGSTQNRRPRRNVTKKRRKRKKRFIQGPPVQYHHAEYEPLGGEQVSETAGHLFKGEHGIITSLRRQTRNVSVWFIDCLQDWLSETLNDKELRDLNSEITGLDEGQSWHCKYCGYGFLVKKNRGIHEKICSQRDDAGGKTRDALS